MPSTRRGYQIDRGVERCIVHCHLWFKGRQRCGIDHNKPGVERKIKVNASFYTGWQKETNRYELLNAKQFETLANDASVAEGGPLLYDPALNPVSTDWQGELFNTYAPTSNYHVSASGGNEVSQYMASFTYFNQKGIIRSSDPRQVLTSVEFRSQAI